MSRPGKRRRAGATPIVRCASGLCGHGRDAHALSVGACFGEHPADEGWGDCPCGRFLDPAADPERGVTDLDPGSLL